MPETYGNIHICKKASKAVNKLTPINRWGGGKQATLGLWKTNSPKFPLDPPAIISNISLATVWYRCNPPVPQCLMPITYKLCRFLADTCKYAREQARLEVDAMAVAVPGGHSGHAPKGQSPGTSIYHNFLPPKPKPGLLDPLGPLAEVYFLSGFRALRDGSGPRRKNQGSTEQTRAPRDGPARRIRAPQDRSGPVGRIRAPQDRSGPARRIKALRDKSGTTERIRASQYKSGPRRTHQSPERRIRTRMTNQGPARRIRAPRDKLGPARWMRAGRTK